MDFDCLFEFLGGCSSLRVVVRFFLYPSGGRCPIRNRTWLVVFELTGGCSSFCAPALSLFEFLGAWVRTVVVGPGVSLFACLFDPPSGGHPSAGHPSRPALIRTSVRHPSAQVRAVTVGYIRPSQ